MLDPSRRQRAEHVSQGSTQLKQRAYKFGAVRVWILLNEFIDIPVLHPFRDHRESSFSQCDTEQRQDVRMPEVFPSNRFSAESL